MREESHSHPSEARLVAHLDGELPPQERAEVSRHLDECPACAASLDELRAASEEFSSAVSRLESPASSLSVADIRRSAGRGGSGSGGSVVGRVDEEAAGSSPRAAALRVAASVVILLGVAAALPGSPVRSWIGRSVQEVRTLLFDGDGAPEVDDGAVPAPTGADSVEAVERSGLAVGPADGSVLVRLVRVPESTTVRVRLVEGSRAGVWNAGGEYRTASGSIEVTAPTSGELLVELPRSVHEVRLEVNGETAAVKEGSRLDVRVAGAVLRDGQFEFTPARGIGGTK